jgi:hypothetical protein
LSDESWTETWVVNQMILAETRLTLAALLK